MCCVLSALSQYQPFPFHLISFVQGSCAHYMVMPNHRTFYRVEDEDSRARTTNSGIKAAGKAQVNFRSKSPELREHVKRHMDWSDRNPSPFISAYSNKKAAYDEAERRKAGKESYHHHRDSYRAKSVWQSTVSQCTQTRSLQGLLYSTEGLE
ncbi:hypothetical protein HD806DRAFT_487438 [Xylariaceae sp. AK1471]|nr:hypothetical protein HD806DRAFT_487438 [Xylariaceae sp. AK1471]